MSRARPVAGQWFDTTRNGQKATAEQLELLASAEDIDLDDLLDEGLSQGDVILRLRTALGEGQVPPEVELRKRRDAAARQVRPKCRICEKEGNSTRHHFVNRWLMRELSDYPQIGSRRLCTIPICTDDHRDLHTYNGSDKSIVPYLEPSEKKFAQKVIQQLFDEHPKIFLLLAGGDPQVYESQLIQDWIAGRFN